jgi:hypothetical protein
MKRLSIFIVAALAVGAGAAIAQSCLTRGSAPDPIAKNRIRAHRHRL